MVVEQAVSPELQVGAMPTHSGLVLVPQAVQAERVGVAQGLGVLPELHSGAEAHTGWRPPPQGTQAVPAALGMKLPVHAVTRQAPVEQVNDDPLVMRAALQARPQPPQCSRLVLVFTQPAPVAVQSVVPPGHEVMHTPAEQTWPPRLALPQVPQLALSV